MASWQPQEQDLQGIVKLLNDYSSTNSQVQAQVVKVFIFILKLPGISQHCSLERYFFKHKNKQLESFSKIPDFNNYLAYIFILQSLDSNVRSVAGLYLKNNVRLHFNHFPVRVLEYITTTSLQALADSHANVRSTAGYFNLPIYPKHHHHHHCFQGFLCLFSSIENIDAID